jgi:pyruvate,water dikinase
MAVDSSWGLGESVVNGSVVADHFVWNKVEKKMVERRLGEKEKAHWLRPGGGVVSKETEAAKRKEWSLSDQQIAQLASLLEAVEDVYKVPMDCEWALDATDRLVLLQARPITTLFPLPDCMRSQPGEKRILYMDCCLMDGPTTNEPLSRMDLDVLQALWTSLVQPYVPEFEFGSEAQQDLMFPAGARLYANFSHCLRFMTPEQVAKEIDTLDPHCAEVVKSLDVKKYKSPSLPQHISFRIIMKVLFRNWRRLYGLWSKAKGYKKQPKEQVQNVYKPKLAEYREAFKAIIATGPGPQGIARYMTDMFKHYGASGLLEEDLAAVGASAGDFKALNKRRMQHNVGSKERLEAETLLMGYPGNEVVEMGHCMFELAHALPSSYWKEYSGRLDELGEHIIANLEGAARDLPEDFLSMWRRFMEKWGCRGPNEVSVSSKRYGDTPRLVLTQLQSFSGPHVKSPAEVQKTSIEKRSAMEATPSNGRFCCRRHRADDQRSARMQHLAGLRDNPKLRMVEMCYELRKVVLREADRLVAAGRLDAREDVFLLTFDELDKAVQNEAFDVKAAVDPHRSYWTCAQKVHQWPLLVDSRNRILRPAPSKVKDGQLAGIPISSGVARGRVRVLTSVDEAIEPGEILAAVVTDPGWTPLFVGASAVVMQIGGVLQHGGLVAREYGKPCVSGIPVLTALRTGMLVEVNGDTGIISVLEEGPDASTGTQAASTSLCESVNVPLLN